MGPNYPTGKHYLDPQQTRKQNSVKHLARKIQRVHSRSAADPQKQNSAKTFGPLDPTGPQEIRKQKSVKESGPQEPTGPQQIRKHIYL